MAYDEIFAEKVRARLDALYGDLVFEEKKMFGGLSFLLAGNMSVGILGGDLIARVEKEHYEDWVGEPGARPMLFTGREMRGFIEVDGGLRGAALDKWIRRSVGYVQTLPPKQAKQKKH